MTPVQVPSGHRRRLGSNPVWSLIGRAVYQQPGVVIPSRPVRVFLSHSQRDRWIARQIDRHLRESGGVETFLDENDIQGGDRITDAVRAGLVACDEFVVILSAASVGSDWVKAEIGGAWILQKRIIIVLDKLSPRDIPQIVSDYKAFDLNDIERYLEEVRSRLRSP